MASRANQPSGARQNPNAPKYFQRPTAQYPDGPNPAGTIIDPEPPVLTDTSAPQHEGFKNYNNVLGGEAVGQERETVAPGETRNRPRRGEVFDAFTLAPEDLVRYGIEGAIPACLADHADVPGDKVYIAVRDPAAHGKVDAHHIRAKRLSRPSLKFVKDEEGNPVAATYDLIFAVVDRAEYLGRQNRHNAYAHQATKGLIEGSMASDAAEEGALENFRGEDLSYLRKQRNKYHALFGGMKQNWPRGMKLETIEEHVGVERTLDIERKWARHGRTEREDEREEFVKMRSARAKGKSWSLPGRATK